MFHVSPQLRRSSQRCSSGAADPGSAVGTDWCKPNWYRGAIFINEPGFYMPRLEEEEEVE